MKIFYLVLILTLLLSANLMADPCEVIEVMCGDSIGGEFTSLNEAVHFEIKNTVENYGLLTVTLDCQNPRIDITNRKCGLCISADSCFSGTRIVEAHLPMGYYGITIHGIGSYQVKFFCGDCQLPVDVIDFQATWYTNGQTSGVLTATRFISDGAGEILEIWRNGQKITEHLTQQSAGTEESFSYWDANIRAGEQYTYSLISVALNGERDTLAQATATAQSIGMIRTQSPVVLNCHPNPVKDLVKVNLLINGPESQKLDISVFNLVGQKIATIANDYFPPGNHSLSFQLNNYPNGMYFVAVHGQTTASWQKILLIK